MDVSIIFVNYNTVKLLIDAIDSVLSKTIAVDFELIVIDNASSDNSKNLLADRYNNTVTYLSLPENIGFGRANNEGMKVAKGRNILLLNPDTLLLNNAIKEMSEYLDAHEDVGVVGANLYNEDGSPQPCFSHIFPSIGFLLAELFHIPSIYNKAHINHTNEPLQVKSVVGAALMIKKKVIDKVGDFDPNFFMYAEEEELCYRVRKGGYKIFNLPTAKITHLDGKSFVFSEVRQKRRLEGTRTLYKVTYSKFYCSAIRAIENITIVNRIAIFKLLKNQERLKYWQFMYDNRKWH